MTIWWPSLDDLKDLIIEEVPNGIAFSAPEGSECAKWLDHYNQTEELRQEFSKAITEAITRYINKEEACGST